MDVNEPRSRRSFLTDLLTRAAGLWVAGGALLAACAPTTKYGGPPASEAGGGLADLNSARKYGGPFLESVPDAGSPEAVSEDAGVPGEVTIKYGGPPEVAPEPVPPVEEQPVTKYGGPPRPRPDAGRPVTKYGGPWR